MGLTAYVFECNGCKREVASPATNGHEKPKGWHHLCIDNSFMLFCGGCLSRVFKALPPLKALFEESPELLATRRARARAEAEQRR